MYPKMFRSMYILGCWCSRHRHFSTRTSLRPRHFDSHSISILARYMCKLAFFQNPLTSRDWLVSLIAIFWDTHGGSGCRTTYESKTSSRSSKMANLHKTHQSRTKLTTGKAMELHNSKDSLSKYRPWAVWSLLILFGVHSLTPLCFCVYSGIWSEYVCAK